MTMEAPNVDQVILPTASKDPLVKGGVKKGSGFSGPTTSLKDLSHLCMGVPFKPDDAPLVLGP